MAKFARVIVDQSGSSVLDYEIPPEFEEKVLIGARVSVPVKSRSAMATVVQLIDETSVSGVRLIEGVAVGKPPFSPLLIELGQWVSEYYCCPLEAAMRSILPQVI